MKDFNSIWLLNELVQLGQNFDFRNKEGMKEKNSYKRRIYDSVDDRSLS